MKRVAILISGGGSNMLSLINAMAAIEEAEPVLVVSNRPDAGGLVKATGLGVPTAVIDHRPFAGDRAAFEQALTICLREASADVICLAGFMRILSSEFVRDWRSKILNIHPSLLPKYKGLNTHQRALDAADTESGCTVHAVTEALDDGPILGQARVPILKSDTAESLAARVLEMEHKLYPRVLKSFLAGETSPIFLSYDG